MEGFALAFAEVMFYFRECYVSEQPWRDIVRCGFYVQILTYPTSFDVELDKNKASILVKRMIKDESVAFGVSKDW